MTKGSEVLESLDKLEECAYAMKDLPMSNWIDLAENEAELDLKIMDWVETIKLELFKGKQALLELKAIKEANHSEALKALDRNIVVIREKDYTIIEQTLLNAQELQKENQELIKKADCCLWKDCNKISQENQDLKRKYENRDYLYQNEVSKNGALAGKIFEKDLKIQKLEKAIKKAIELLFIDGKGTKKQVLNLLKEVLENE